MTEQMRALALIHVKAFNFSKGLVDVQADYLARVLPEDQWLVTGNDLITDPDAAEVLFTHFRRQHPTMYVDEPRDKLLERIKVQINHARSLHIYGKLGVIVE